MESPVKMGEVHSETTEKHSELTILSNARARVHFVKFDNNARMQADKVDAAELAELATKHCIDTVVLNACESAKGAASASNLAHVLTEAGVKTTIGMSFEVLSLSAELFMKAFYEVLLTHNGHALDAVSRARAALLRMPKRKTRYGVQIDLYDHIIPIVHSGEASLSEFLQQPTPSYPSPELSIPLQSLQEVPLYGRESTILELENVLAQNPPFKVFVRGSPGIGKTALLRHACQWWKETELYHTVIFLPLHEPEYQNLTFSTFIRKIHENFPSIPMDDKALIKALNNKYTLLVLDSLDSITWDSTKDRMQEIRCLNRLIQRLRKCGVVLVSRCETTYLDWDYSIVIGPLNLEAAASFGLRYLEQKDPSGQVAAKARNQLADFKQLIDMMAGNPLAIRMMIYDLCMNLQSTDGATIQSHVEALLNHRIIILEDTTCPHEEQRAIAELSATLLKLSPPLDTPTQQDVVQDNSIHESANATPSSDARGSLPPLRPSDQGLYFNLCLSLAGFWNHMFQDFESFAMMFVCINQAQHLVSGEDLEFIVRLLLTPQTDGQNLVDWMQEWYSTTSNPLGPVMERCARRATKAPSWIKSLLENELCHYVIPEGKSENIFTSGELDVSFYMINPIFRLLARSSITSTFWSSELRFSMDLSIMKLYMQQLSRTYDKSLLQNRNALHHDHERLGQLDFWNHLSVAMTHHRAPSCPKTVLGFEVSISRSSSNVVLEKLPFLDLMTRNFVTTLIGELNEVKAALSLEIQAGQAPPDISSTNESHKLLWLMGQLHESCFSIMFQLGVSCCAKIGISDDFYLQAKAVYDKDPLYMSNPYLDDQSRRMLKAKEQHTTALINSRTEDVDESTIRNIEELQKELFSAFFDKVGVVHPHQRDDASNRFQSATLFAPVGEGALPESIEARFWDITKSQQGRVESTELIHERISKLHDLLSEDMPPLWRRNIHQALSMNHSRLGEYLLATEHNRLRYDEERKCDPETLAMVTANDQATDRYWTRESTRSTTVQRTIQEIEALIEQEMSSLQTGLQTLNWGEPSILAKVYRIGLLFIESQRYSEAIPYLQVVLGYQLRASGVNVEGVLEPTFALAQALERLNRLDEAIDILRPVVVRALEQKNNRLVMSEFFVNAQISLGRMISRKLKNWSKTTGADPTSLRELSQEVRGYFETGLCFFRNTYGPNSAEAINCMVNFAAAIGDASELQAAEDQLQEALRTRRAETQDPCDMFVRFLETLLETLFIEKRRFDEYEKLMLDSLQRLLSQFGTSSVYTLDQINSLGFMYEATDRLDEARKLAVEYFDALFTTGRLKANPNGFTFGAKNLGLSCFEAQASRLLESLKSHAGIEATESEPVNESQGS